MTSEAPLIVKLGGSVVTEKSEFMTANVEAIGRLSREIREAGARNLVLVHGGGSFGHPLARKYGLKQGLVEGRQLEGFASTHLAMTKLNTLIVESLTNEGLPAVSVRPSTFIVAEAGRIETSHIEPLRKLLQLGLLPVLCGDVVADRRRGFTVLSGDQLCSRLALDLGSKRIVLGVDVDGFYTADPKTDSAAQMVEEATSSQLRSMLERVRASEGMDVTGGMVGKMWEMLPFIEKGGIVLVVNAARAGRLSKALKGEQVYGTLIRPG